MYIDKLIRKEILTLITSLLILLTVFIGVSFAAFFSSAQGNSNTISIGDLEIQFCEDNTCQNTYENIGQVIGKNNNNEIISITPYNTHEEALSKTPYIFNIKNIGNLDINLTSFLTEETNINLKEEYNNYTSLTDKYKSHLLVGISDCTNKINIEEVEIHYYKDLDENKIITKEKISSGKEKTYCLWTWLDNKTPNDAQRTYFIANLNFEAEYSPKGICATNTFEKGTLKYKMLDDNCVSPDSQRSEYVTKIGGIDYTKNSSDINGKGLYFTQNTENNEDINNDGIGETVYFYRGNILNNYVVLKNMCFKIIRTNEDGSIKLRYNGTYENGICTDNNTLTSLYNNTYNDNAYIGYMMGIKNECITGTCKSKENSNSYENAHKNTYNSTIKTVVDSWYEENIIKNNLENYIKDTIYCNDRSLNSGKGYSNYISSYNVTKREKPIYKCINQNDKFGVNVGNKSLKYPVSILTIDEAKYAGLTTEANETNFLNTQNSSWLMGSSFIDSNKIYLDIKDGYIDGKINNEKYVYPVISLKEDVKVTGNGLYNDPYIVE